MPRKPRRSRRDRSRRAPAPDAEALLRDAEAALAAAGPATDPEELAARCLAAGDALRREDRPVRAARMLQRAVDLSTDPGRRTSARLVLAGVLADAGELQASADVARQVLAQPASADAHILGQDILAGALLAQGRLAEARGVVAALAAAAPQLPVLPFRRAALARLDGQLDRADALLEGVLRDSPQTAAWRGPRAAAVMERAELALLRGDSAAAVDGFTAALGLWAEVGRRAGAFRAEAGRVRARVEAGDTVLKSILDNPLAYAAERRLPVLEAELLLAQGMALAATDRSLARRALDRAVELAAHTGALFLEGRCRLARVLHLGDTSDRARLVRCLAEDRVWSARIPR